MEEMILHHIPIVRPSKYAARPPPQVLSQQVDLFDVYAFPYCLDHPLKRRSASSSALSVGEDLVAL